MLTGAIVKDFFTKNLSIIATLGVLIVNIIALFVLIDTIERNNTIIENLGEQVTLQRANLVKSYSDFEPIFTITVHSFYPKQSLSPHFPIDIINSAKYRIQGTIWIYPEEICINKNPTSIMPARTYGQSFDIEKERSMNMTIPMIEDYVAKLDEIDSFIIKVLVVSSPYDTTVGSIDELEKQRYTWIKFEHQKTLGALFPSHVSTEKIKCDDFVSWNPEITIPSTHDWFYSENILRMANP